MSQTYYTVTRGSSICLTYYLYKLSGSLIRFDKLVCIPNILVSYFDDDCEICRHMLVNE